jgi:hypothetical protein
LDGVLGEQLGDWLLYRIFVNSENGSEGNCNSIVSHHVKFDFLINVQKIKQC